VSDTEYRNLRTCIHCKILRISLRDHKLMWPMVSPDSSLQYEYPRIWFSSSSMRHSTTKLWHLVMCTDVYLYGSKRAVNMRPNSVINLERWILLSLSYTMILYLFLLRKHNYIHAQWNPNWVLIYLWFHSFIHSFIHFIFRISIYR
jgi:hypothetical protein